MDRKLLYTAPLCSVYTLEAQGEILIGSGSLGDPGSAGGVFGDDNTDDYSDILL